MLNREEMLKAVTRRQLFKNCVSGIGAVALASLMNDNLFAATAHAATSSIDPLAPKLPHYAAKAKHVIFLHMAGAPSQLDLFDYKPKLIEFHGKPVGNTARPSSASNQAPAKDDQTLIALRCL